MNVPVPEPPDGAASAAGPAEGGPSVAQPVDGANSVPEPVEGTRRGAPAAGRTDYSAGRGEARVRSHRSPLPLVLLAVFTAGVLGTAARLLLDAAIPPGPGGVPVSTLLINTAGSFVLGVVVATVPRTAPEWLRAGVTTGLLGSFTTFSALTVAAVALAGSAEVLPAAVLLILSVVTGVTAAVAGVGLGSVLPRGRR